MKDNNKNKFPWSDFWAIVCGAICLVRGIWFSYDVFRFHSPALYCFPPPMQDWYNIPQIVLCLAGIFLTAWRFLRKSKSLTYKEYEWIPLVISIVYWFVVCYLAVFIIGLDLSA